MKFKIPFYHMSLKYKFVAVFLLFVTLPTICISLFIYSQINGLMKKQLIASNTTAIGKINSNLTSVVDDIESVSLYTIYNNDFHNFMTIPQKDQNNPTYQQTLVNIKGYLTFQLMSKSYISSFKLVGENGSTLEMGDALTGDESKWDHLARQKEGGIVWSDTYTLQNGGYHSKNVISLFRVINDLNHINHPIGLARIRLDANKLKQLIEMPSLINKGSLFLINNNGEVLIKSGKKLQISKEKFKILAKEKVNKSSFSTNISGVNYLTLERPVSGTHWTLIDMVGYNQIGKSLLHIRQLMRDLLILLTILGLVALILYYYSNVKRIIKLTESTRQVENRDFSVVVDVKVKDEIGKLGHRFNKMVETIQQYIEREYELKIRQKESELKALQNQIDPHFLYNTLDMIRWKARLEDAEETSYLIELLSKLFRNSLKSGSLFITLKDEVAYLGTYLELQQRRIGETFKFEFSMDDSLKNSYIMKQLLQPIIENSIKHGFNGIRGEKLLSIRFTTDQNVLFVDVRDNGIGMGETVFQESLSKKEEDALKNIQERVRLAFGEEFGLKLMPNEERGTWIRLMLPFLDSRSQIKAIYQDMGELDHD